MSPNINPRQTPVPNNLQQIALARSLQQQNQEIPTTTEQKLRMSLLNRKLANQEVYLQERVISEEKFGGRTLFRFFGEEVKVGQKKVPITNVFVVSESGQVIREATPEEKEFYRSQVRPTLEVVEFKGDPVQQVFNKINTEVSKTRFSTSRGFVPSVSQFTAGFVGSFTMRGESYYTFGKELVTNPRQTIPTIPPRFSGLITSQLEYFASGQFSRDVRLNPSYTAGKITGDIVFFKGVGKIGGRVVGPLIPKRTPMIKEESISGFSTIRETRTARGIKVETAFETNLGRSGRISEIVTDIQKNQAKTTFIGKISEPKGGKVGFVGRADVMFNNFLARFPQGSRIVRVQGAVSRGKIKSFETPYFRYGLEFPTGRIIRRQTKTTTSEFISGGFNIPLYKRLSLSFGSSKTSILKRGKQTKPVKSSNFAVFALDLRGLFKRKIYFEKTTEKSPNQFKSLNKNQISSLTTNVLQSVIKEIPAKSVYKAQTKTTISIKPITTEPTTTQKTQPKQISMQRISVFEIPSYKQPIKQNQKIDQINIQQQNLRQNLTSKQKINFTTRQIQIPQQQNLQDQTQKTIQLQIPKLSQQQKQRNFLRTILIKTPRIPQPLRIPVPSIDNQLRFTFSFKQIKQSTKITPSIPVLVRRGGVFKVVGSGKTFKEALQIGKSVTSKTLAASFKIPSINKYLRLKGFKTKTTTSGVIFIEKPKYRLSTLSEIFEIQSARRK
ncbi:MAG: hypothetical protein KatS3mg096_716 [Candidatus Parcubacteria bacterium]|nr:MAG: hypothetical protein KatS3mg096_716 [Candidatus Parcubacteria bacterium]